MNYTNNCAHLLNLAFLSIIVCNLLCLILKHFKALHIPYTILVPFISIIAFFHSLTSKLTAVAITKFEIIILVFFINLLIVLKRCKKILCGRKKFASIIAMVKNSFHIVHVSTISQTLHCMCTFDYDLTLSISLWFDIICYYY